MNNSHVSSASRPQAAIIGAGIAGLLCAQKLAACGVPVQVFDKSRGVGGRLATRRTPDGIAFDHGAQYFTIRDPRFAALVAQWEQAGVVGRWEGRIVSLEATGVRACESIARYVGTPSMTAIAKYVSQDLPITLNARITSLERQGPRWRLRDEAGQDHGEFDIVLVTIPPEQAAPLVASSSHLATEVAQVRMQPCWAVMASFAAGTEVPFAGAFVSDSPLSWIACNSGKPGRCATPETWVLHASRDWSTEHLELSAEEVVTQLCAALRRAWPDGKWEPTSALAHRWRYAIPQNPLAQLAYYDAEIGLGIGGDWCGGPRVEGAALSGWALADAVMPPSR